MHLRKSKISSGGERKNKRKLIKIKVNEKRAEKKKLLFEVKIKKTFFTPNSILPRLADGIIFFKITGNIEFIHKLYDCCAGQPAVVNILLNHKMSVHGNLLNFTTCCKNSSHFD